MKYTLAFVLAALSILGRASAKPQYNPQFQQLRPAPYYNRSVQQPNSYYRRSVDILRQNHVQDIDGTYDFSYDTENGIRVAEQGRPVGKGPYGTVEVVQGQYSYTAPDGQPIQLRYIADENGFQAFGAHLPTPPPIPPAIQRALAHNAANPQEDNDNYSDNSYRGNRFN